MSFKPDNISSYQDSLDLFLSFYNLEDDTAELSWSKLPKDVLIALQNGDLDEALAALKRREEENSKLSKKGMREFKRILDRVAKSNRFGGRVLEKFLKRLKQMASLTKAQKSISPEKSLAKTISTVITAAVVRMFQMGKLVAQPIQMFASKATTTLTNLTTAVVHHAQKFATHLTKPVVTFSRKISQALSKGMIQTQKVIQNIVQKVATPVIHFTRQTIVSVNQVLQKFVFTPVLKAYQQVAVAFQPVINLFEKGRVVIDKAILNLQEKVIAPVKGVIENRLLKPAQQHIEKFVNQSQRAAETVSKTTQKVAQFIQTNVFQPLIRPFLPAFLAFSKALQTSREKASNHIKRALGKIRKATGWAQEKAKKGFQNTASAFRLCFHVIFQAFNRLLQFVFNWLKKWIERIVQFIIGLVTITFTISIRTPIYLKNVFVGLLKAFGWIGKSAISSAISILKTPS